MVTASERGRSPGAVPRGGNNGFVGIIPRAGTARCPCAEMASMAEWPWLRSAAGTPGAKPLSAEIMVLLALSRGRRTARCPCAAMASMAEGPRRRNAAGPPGAVPQGGNNGFVGIIPRAGTARVPTPRPFLGGVGYKKTTARGAVVLVSEAMVGAGIVPR